MTLLSLKGILKALAKRFPINIIEIKDIFLCVFYEYSLKIKKLYVSSSSQEFRPAFLCTDRQCDGEIITRHTREFILSSRQWFVMPRESVRL
jgi:hypothetical protein